MEIISRKEAIAAGLKWYFTGKPCPHGHVAPRQISSSSCRDCAALNGRRHYGNNRQDYIDRAKAQYLADPDAGRARARRNASLQPREKLQARYAERRKKFAVELAIYQQLWRLANPERASKISRAGDAARRARERQAKGRYTSVDVTRLLRAQKRRCACCSIRLTEYHVDHIEPLAKGGGNGADNIQLLCPSCNRSKGAKHPVDFMRERGFLC